jgi:hypothetical protein
MAAAASSLKSQAGELVQTVAVFKLGSSGGYTPTPPPTKKMAPPASPPKVVERRGPDRAVNVARLKKPSTSPVPVAQAKSGTEGEWTSF